MDCVGGLDLTRNVSGLSAWLKLLNPFVSNPAERISITAYPERDEIGRFRGSFLYDCHPSQDATKIPSIISATTPQKTHFWPQWDFRLDDLKSSISRYSCLSPNDSKNSPHATAAAPSDAKTEMQRTLVIYFLVTGVPWILHLQICI
jgi:hypothetical protein